MPEFRVGDGKFAFSTVAQKLLFETLYRRVRDHPGRRMEHVIFREGVLLVDILPVNLAMGIDVGQ
jgi:hypothetical protein